jgi:hypothetical protein
MDSRLHRTHDLRGRRLSHHFKRAYGLVYLLAGKSQLAGIHRRHIHPSRSLRIAQVTLQRLDGRLNGLSRFVQHPSQRAKVAHVIGNTQTIFSLGTHDHGYNHS